MGKKIGTYMREKWDRPEFKELRELENLDSQEICEVLEIPLEKMPQPYPSGQVIGEVTKEAAEETGFLEGTPIISGAGDQQAGPLGLGVVDSAFPIVALLNFSLFVLFYCAIKFQ